MSGSRALASTISVRVPTPVGQRFVVRPAPAREPQFDDELAPRHLSLVGPLDRPLPFSAEDLNVPCGLRLSTVDNSFEPRPTGRAELPELNGFTRRLLIGIIETATGRRPAAQLAQHTAPAVQAGLARDAGRIVRLGTTQRPATVHSIHIIEPADGVAEIAAIVRVGERFRAMALRLEGLDGRWRCVRLQIG
jgi:hypothetical protein